ncbi:MAG: T9SS type A sorting domain-containing protein [Candidatus Eisenbacteria bacterium]|nr:T9SS type A sorting domain-containing protein [Candidatus Eisenbacteria bacterium]
MKRRCSANRAVLRSGGAALLAVLFLAGATAGEVLVVYETSFDALALGHTLPHPGDPGQDGWFQTLAVGDAFGEIQEAVAVAGRALHEYAPATNPCCVQTIDRRDLVPPDLSLRPVITLSGDFFCRTSDLAAVNPYSAAITVSGGPHPGYHIIDLTLGSGNGMAKGDVGVFVSIGCFNGVDNNEPIPLTVGQELAWDTWHHFQLAIDHARDTYLYLEVDGERQQLFGYAPPRSFWEGEWRRGQLIEAVSAEVIASQWDPPNVSDDDVYWDNLKLTVVEPRFQRQAVQLGPEGISTPNDLGLIGSDPIALLPSFPNPARGTTTLRFLLPRDAQASLRVFDVSGRRVRTLVENESRSGMNESLWDGRDDRGVELPSGVYFLRLEAGSDSRSERILLVR